MEAGRLSAAANAFQGVLVARPDNPDALHLAGLAAHRLGDNERALILVRRAIALQPGQAQSHYNLAEIQRSMDLIEPAIVVYRCAADLAPGTP
ncbi:MAG: tetratricopeptide repeat protein, partial [Alphaproteobacteria bacterium]|nr:tetratricopeptide repeat protein [Alphaproteobacteria bacterium]